MPIRIALTFLDKGKIAWAKKTRKCESPLKLATFYAGPARHLRGFPYATTANQA
jgi:hypothetical protein